MYIKESIREKITQFLYGCSFEKLTPLWQEKVAQAADIVYAEIIKPLRKMNSALLDTELSLQEELNYLQSENLRLKQIIENLQAIDETKSL